MRRDVFQGIADPTRRAIIDLVSKSPVNLNAIAETFNMSRQAVTKHIKILEECGLLGINSSGREKLCEATPEKLLEVYEWSKQYKKLLAERMKSTDDNVIESSSKKKKSGKKKKHAKKHLKNSL